MRTLPRAAKRGNIQTLKVRVGGVDGHTVTVTGRLAWALQRLLDAGDAGCTPIDEPGPRWSHYISKLRLAGVAIRTLHESHGGAYPGHHGRYVLDCSVVILERVGVER